MTLQRLASPITLLCLLTACTDTPSTRVPNETDAEAASLGVLVAPPSGFRAIDRASLRPIVTINGETFALDGDGSGPTTLTRTYPPGTGLVVTVDWRRRLDDLVVWRASSGRVVGEDDLTLRIGPDDYVSAGEAAVFDVDADGLSNLAELDCASDPLSAISVCEARAPDPSEPDPDPEPVPIPDDVRASIARLPEGVPAPSIDGRLEEPGGTLADGPWRFATERDVDGARLSIDNLMLQPGVGPVRSNPAYRWRAVHDGETLYVHVVGKPVGDPVHADSTDAFHDDSMALFLDGDASAGNVYDEVDDYSTYMPMTTLSGEPNSDLGRVQSGLNSASLGVPDALRFAVCACPSEYAWEVALPLASIGAGPDDVIGLEVQIDEDNDGENRDARFGWNNPSLGDLGIGSTDFAWRDPSYFGRVHLQP